MFHQSINLPLLIESVDLNKLSFKEFFNTHNLSFKKIFILTGGKKSSYFTDIIAENNKAMILIHNNTDNSLKEISQLKNSVYKFKADAIIGVGGGKVLDTAKSLATRTKLPYFAIPTVVSTDALASPISILKNETGTKGYPAVIPSGILIDYEIISESGETHIISGLGDIISNISALNDWDLAVKAQKAKANNFARFLSEVSVNNILNQKVDFKDPTFIKTYLNSIIMSGLAMNISGNSRPCSGSEHLIAHAMTSLNLSKFAHGKLVGSLTPFTLYLQEDNKYKWFKKNSFSFLDINVLEETDQSKIFKLAKQVRGGRHTILNQFSDSDLKNKYLQFLDTWIK